MIFLNEILQGMRPARLCYATGTAATLVNYVLYCTSYTNISAGGLLGTPVIDILEVRYANQLAITGVALCQTLLTAFLWALIAGFLNIKEYLYWKIHSTPKFSTSYCLRV